MRAGERKQVAEFFLGDPRGEQLAGGLLRQDLSRIRA